MNPIGLAYSLRLAHYLPSCMFVYINIHDLIQQILTNVNWRHFHAIPMPTVLIQMAASSAHVWLDLKAMDLIVQVKIEEYTFVYLS